MRRLEIFRSALVAMATAGPWLEPRSARAQDATPGILDSRHSRRESPQNFALELRFSPFKPDIDSDPKLQGKPYGDTFGSTLLLFAAEFDWQAARIPHVGTVGPGMGLGYATTSAKARFAQPHNGNTTSGEDTTLQILPTYLVAVLRADAIWREARVPLVPYAKLGVGLSFWRASNTLGTSNSGGITGEGHTWGSELAVGLAFNLNVFDEYAARNFDESMGVNGTYVYAEWTRSDLTGLWAQQSPLRVGGTFWTFGLTFEF